MTDPAPAPSFRDLVVPEHMAFFDFVEHLLREDTMQQITLAPPIWAALCVALAESVQAHRILAAHGNPVASARLALVETLLVEITAADHVDDVLPPDIGGLD